MKLTITLYPDTEETGENLALILRKAARAIDIEHAQEGDFGAGNIEMKTGNSNYVSYEWKLEAGE